MSRLLGLLSAVVLPLAVAPAAPIPPPPKTPPLYFPTKIGTKWVYFDQDTKTEIAEVVMDVKEKDGEKWVLVGSERKGKVDYRRSVSVSDKGIALVDSDISDLAEPTWLLKLPYKQGNKWDYVIALSSVGKWKGLAVADGLERVEVPAGKFEAIRVKLDLTFAGERGQSTRWYAPGVGKVKEKAGDSVEVLKSFTPGKD